MSVYVKYTEQSTIQFTHLLFFPSALATIRQSWAFFADLSFVLHCASHNMRENIISDSKNKRCRGQGMKIIYSSQTRTYIHEPSTSAFENPDEDVPEDPIMCKSRPLAEHGQPYSVEDFGLLRSPLQLHKVCQPSAVQLPQCKTNRRDR